MMSARRLVALAAGLLITATSLGSATASTITAYDHIFLVVLENHSYGQIVGSSSAPYINSLIAANALATNYYAKFHPSLPNYLALTGGSSFNNTPDCSPTSCPVTAKNIGATLEPDGRK